MHIVLCTVYEIEEQERSLLEVFLSTVVQSYEDVEVSGSEFLLCDSQADVVSLALPLDVLKIEEAGLIDSDWQKRVSK